MPDINYYGIVDEDYIKDAERYTLILEMLCGMTMFSIKDVIMNDNGFEIIGYEKSFWHGKKKKAYLKVEYFDNTGFIMKTSDPNEQSNYLNRLMGFEFWSEYESIRDQNFNYFKLGLPRKEIVSVKIIEIFIKVGENSYNNSMLSSIDELSLDNPRLSSDYHHSKEQLAYLWEVRKLLKLTKADLEKAI